ncbi:hypothetical protein CMO96_04955 [Candidatus Woesebacteria bacterium]|nr:hypothetical protein [Candidatus Woesebacteria bacterium]
MSKLKTQMSKPFFVLVTCYLLLVTLTPVSALSGECAASSIPFHKLDTCIAEIEREVSALTPAHEQNQEELSGLRKQLKSIQGQIANLTRQANALAADIRGREEDLVLQQELLEERIREFYIRSRQYSPIVVFLSTASATEFTRELVLREQAATEDRRTIEDLAEKIIGLKDDKKTLENSRAGLKRVQAEVDSRATFLAGEVEKVESYISSLSAKQQQLLAQKAGGFQTSIGETPPTLDPCSGPPGSSNYCDPGFGGFAVFSFGAPHRAGMSQFGAYGRAKSGQNAESILSAYYQGADLNKGYSVPGSINVSGYGSLPFEDNYLLGIYEVPESWGDKGGFEALKAQAVAARTYALAVTNNGQGTICPTESCQVYKPQLKSGKWKEAVQQTRGWVLTRGGSPAKTYYASTSGGFTLSKWGWNGIKDAKDGDWPNQAYEKVSESPWFYKAWYKTRSGKSCGMGNPWLTTSEMADVLNAWHVLYKGGGDVSRVSPTDTGCWQGNPYSSSELASIGGYTNVSSASVVYGNDGSTIQVTFSTNKGSTSISGEEFKKAFNLRAPGYIGVKSTLFNVVRTN